MKLAFKSDGTMAMHLAPFMIPSGIALSGADMIWFRMVLEVCTRSKVAPRRSEAAAHKAIETTTIVTTESFFIAQLRSTQCSRPALPTGAILLRIDASLGRKK